MWAVREDGVHGGGGGGGGQEVAQAVLQVHQLQQGARQVRADSRVHKMFFQGAPERPVLLPSLLIPLSSFLPPSLSPSSTSSPPPFRPSLLALSSTTLRDHEGTLFCPPCHSRSFGLKGYGYGMGAGTLASEAGVSQTDQGRERCPLLPSPPLCQPSLLPSLHPSYISSSLSLSLPPPLLSPPPLPIQG